MVRQARAAPAPPSAEALQLRERFEDAVATLKQQRVQTLYDLPWYMFIGAPGSGKTTALINSGLKFPLEQRTGKGALRGVGGTRNCDWSIFRQTRSWTSACSYGRAAGRSCHCGEAWIRENRGCHNMTLSEYMPQCA